MTPLVAARLALLLAAIVLFVLSVRTGLDPYRYVAIGLLVVAVVVRFVDRSMARRDERNTSDDVHAGDSRKR